MDYGSNRKNTENHVICHSLFSATITNIYGSTTTVIGVGLWLR